MENELDKPKRTPTELINIMKTNGITFIHCCEEDAIRHLQNNNYFRLASYRENYSDREQKGNYTNLDFAYLYELALIDMKIRRTLLKLCIDLEHFLKISIKNEFDVNPHVTGTSLVRVYLEANEKVSINLSRKLNYNSVYVGDLAKKYFYTEDDFVINKCPYWVFLEFISFGTFIDFYEFYKYNVNYNVKNELKTNKQGVYELEIINKVRELRNACAHNNCLIFNLKKKPITIENFRYLTQEVQQWLNNLKDDDFKFNKDRVKVPINNQIINLLFLIDKYMPLKFKQRTLDDLKIEFDNITQHKNYFTDNNLIKANYIFIKNCIDKLYTKVYNDNEDKKLIKECF